MEYCSNDLTGDVVVVIRFVNWLPARRLVLRRAEGGQLSAAT